MTADHDVFHSLKHVSHVIRVRSARHVTVQRLVRVTVLELLIKRKAERTVKSDKESKAKNNNKYNRRVRTLRMKSMATASTLGPL